MWQSCIWDGWKWEKRVETPFLETSNRESTRIQEIGNRFSPFALSFSLRLKTGERKAFDDAAENVLWWFTCSTGERESWVKWVWIRFASKKSVWEPASWQHESHPVLSHSQHSTFQAGIFTHSTFNSRTQASRAPSHEAVIDSLILNHVSPDSCKNVATSVLSCGYCYKTNGHKQSMRSNGQLLVE